MRTRIALVATVAVAVLISSTMPARPGSARDDRRSAAASRPVRLPTAQLAAYSRRLAPTDPTPVAKLPGLIPVLTSGHPLVRVAATAPVTPLTPPEPVDTVTPYVRVAWQRVALCEEGGNWAAGGPRFSGGLGISRSNWVAYGGLAYAPEGALAPEDDQIMVAERIQASPPDQHGCRGW